MTWEGDRETVQACIGKDRKAKLLNLVRDVQGSKKSFNRYVSSKGEIRENVGLLLNRDDLMAQDVEEAEVLSTYFILALRLAFRNRSVRPMGNSGAKIQPQ